MCSSFSLQTTGTPFSPHQREIGFTAELELQLHLKAPDRSFRRLQASKFVDKNAQNPGIDGFRDSKSGELFGRERRSYYFHFCYLRLLLFLAYPTQTPDWPSHNFRASRSGAWQILCSSKTSYDGFVKLQSCERVGRVGTEAYSLLPMGSSCLHAFFVPPASSDKKTWHWSTLHFLPHILNML